MISPGLLSDTGRFWYRFRISMLPLVPSVAHQLVYSKKFASADFSTITNVLCGAAALPQELRKRLSGLIGGSSIAEGTLEIKTR